MKTPEEMKERAAKLDAKGQAKRREADALGCEMEAKRLEAEAISLEAQALRLKAQEMSAQLQPIGANTEGANISPHTKLPEEHPESRAVERIRADMQHSLCGMPDKDDDKKAEP